MKSSAIALVLMALAFCTHGQQQSEQTHKGFAIGLGVGFGVLDLKTKDTGSVKFSTTIPNIKLGYRMRNDIEVLLLLPGSNYTYHNKDRGFEAFTVGAQYWLKKHWWVMAGLGVTFDAPAFYTVSDPKTAGFYTGFPSTVGAVGYEFLHKNRRALDIQYRFFYGTSDISDAVKRKGISNMLILGINWY